LITSLRRALTAALPLLLAALVRPASAVTTDDRLGALGDEFVARWLAHAPHEATRLGAHAADGVLLPVTRTTLAEDLTWLRGFSTRLASIPIAELSEARAIEHDLLAGRVERQLIDLEVIRPFERDPGAYLPLVAGSIESVLERPIASPCQRLRLAARRLSLVPEVLRAARINLRNPPRELTEIAIDRYIGALRFYRETVPRLVTGCRDARMQADLAQADTTAVRAVEDFLLYLSEDLLPASRGTLAIGPGGCLRLLRAELLDPAIGESPKPMRPSEIVDATEAVDSLLAEARRVVEERRAALDALAPDGVRAALDALADERTAADGLVPYMERRLDGVREFLRRREIVTVPERTTLGLRGAQGFRAPLALTALDAAGAWESRSTEAWIEVTPPDSIGDERRQLAHLAHFEHREAELAVIHDGLPGLYLRGVALRGLPSRLRQALQGTWSAEDWGEYCEQMMVDEGYGAEDPGYRLAVAARAVRHAGRSYAALALASGAMSFDEARAMLQERCLLDPDDALRETRRAAADPAVMGYTPGARQLLELREEARRVLGSRFQIKVFNDAVLRFGASPAGLVQAGVRRELGVGDGGRPVGARP
jgi:hypothetical protein